MFSLVRSANNKRFSISVTANQKIPAMFAKVGDITGRHYNAQNLDVSFPHAPHRLEGGDV